MPNQNYLLQVFTFQNPDNILNVGIQVDSGIRQMSAFTQACQSRRKYFMTSGSAID